MVATYGVSPIPQFLAAAGPRYAADGVPLPEVLRAQSEITEWSEWWGHWTGRARAFDALAEDAQSQASRYGFGVTASLCAHLAQYLHFGEPDAKHEALRLKIETYRRALRWAPHPTEQIEVPHRMGSVPAILHLPDAGETPVPCVVYVGGLDAHKEDAHQFIELCLNRGLAVAALDGPGQGEAMLRDIRFEEDAHEAISSLIDLLGERQRLDENRIGVIGRSLGGYLAPRAAATDDRIRALVVWATMWDLNVLPDFPEHTRAGFAYITGSQDLSESMERLQFVNLRDHADQISAATLIIHGEKDALTPVEHAHALADAIEDVDLRILEGSEHCNHDIAHIARPAMADWLATQLGGSESR